MEELCHGAHGRFSLGDFGLHSHPHTHANTYIHTYPDGNINRHANPDAFTHAYGDAHAHPNAETRSGGDHHHHRPHPSTSSGQAYDPVTATHTEQALEVDACQQCINRLQEM